MVKKKTTKKKVVKKTTKKIVKKKVKIILPKVVKKTVTKTKVVKKETKKVKSKGDPQQRLLLMLLRQFYLVQEHRIAFAAQIRELEKEFADSDQVEALKSFFNQLEILEKNMARFIDSIVSLHPMYKWLEDVRGIGPIISASLLATIDIKKAQHASSLWKYAGLAVGEDGRADRRQKGKKIEYNPFLKIVCWKIGESFVKSKGKYRNIYDTSRTFYDKKFPKEVNDTKTKRVFYTKMHRYNMAKRRAIKIFLSDFWVEWRETEGLEVSVPFAHRGE